MQEVLPWIPGLTRNFLVKPRTSWLTLEILGESCEESPPNQIFAKKNVCILVFFLAIFCVFSCCVFFSNSPPVMPQRLQIPKWPPGAPKWPLGSGKGSHPRLSGAPNNFCKKVFVIRAHLVWEKFATEKKNGIKWKNGENSGTLTSLLVDRQWRTSVWFIFVLLASAFTL